MATNKVQDGRILRLTVGSGVKSGDPVLVGAGFHGVAITDYSAADGKAEIETMGVFKLSVQAVDGSGNSAVALGDLLYITGSVVSKIATGKLFGVAKGTVASGATKTIGVWLC